jgi:hypothetical protein
MIQWEEVQKALYPIHSFEDLSRHFEEAFSYAFVRSCFNFSIPELTAYTTRLLGEDTRQRYAQYLEFLTRALGRISAAEVPDVRALSERTRTRVEFSAFIAQTGLAPADVVGVLKFLVYWVVPAKKSLNELVKKGQGFDPACAALRQAGVRCNLDLMELGRTPAARRQLALDSGLDEVVLADLVYRADYSRLPWTSLATINNLVYSGYASLGCLAEAPFERVSADFYRYGASIGKNLKLGNEIDNTHRIARLVPKVVS